MRGRFAVTVITVASACGGGGGGPDAGPLVLDACGAGAPPAAVIDVSERFDVFHAGVYGRIGARLYDAPDPAVHELVLDEGECRHYELAAPFCDPACAPGELCAVGDACAPVPAQLGGGRLTITGAAGGDPIGVDPDDFDPGTYVGPGGLTDLFDETTEVDAALAGGDFPALALRGRGVSAIDTALTASGFDLTTGAAAELTWTAGPDPDACVQVVLFGFNESHGAPLNTIIRCESADDGSLTIPQAMVDAFPTGDTPEVTEGYDWPHSELTRYTRARTTVDPGDAVLLVHSTTYFRLRHP
jgi:hypothetical protein